MRGGKLSKLIKLTESYKWVNEMPNKTIIELKKTSDILEEIHNKFFSRFNTSSTKFNALVILYKCSEEGIMLSEIGEQMLVTKANITGLIDRLEKQGLVKRTRDDIDRRKVWATITQKGKIFAKEMIENYKEWSKNIMVDLDDEEKKQFINTLKKIQTRLVKL